MTVADRASTASPPPLLDLVQAARDLAPMIADAVPSYADKADVPLEIVEAMKKAGLHRPYMPKRYGGYEMDWGAHYAISTEIAKACGSAGWLSSLVFSHIFGIGRFPQEAQDAYFAASPDSILGTASAGAGVLERAPGGMRLNGRWSFSSGIKYAGGLMVIAKEGDAPLFTHFCLLLPGEYRIEETWKSEGLTSTGSHDVIITNQFVPEERVVKRDVYLGPTPPGAATNDYYVYGIRPAPYQKSYFLGPMLGMALGARDSYLAQTKKRRGRIFGESIAEQVPIQIQIGTAFAEIDTARLVFDTYVAQLHDFGSRRVELAGEDLLWGKRNVTHASRLCLSAVDRLLGSMGVGGMAAANPVQRHYRDTRTIMTHIELNWDHAMAPTGKHALDLPTGDPLIDGQALLPGSAPAMLGTQV